MKIGPPMYFQAGGVESHVCVRVPIPFPVSVQDVMDLERKYWCLKSSPRFDLELFTSLVCPPVPKELVEGGRGGVKM